MCTVWLLALLVQLHLGICVRIFVSPSALKTWQPTADWQPENARKAAANCPVDCSITDNPEDSDCIVYSCNERSSFSNPYDKARKKLKAIHCWEAHSKYPLDEADFYLTYDLVETTRIIPISYIWNLTHFLALAKRSLEHKKIYSEVAFVSRRSEPFRDKMMLELNEVYPVSSYGDILHNTDWPKGHDRDKGYVMRNHKFCLAIENAQDLGYTTEKLWECLSSASVPVYYGNVDCEKHHSVPANSYIDIKKFPNMQSVGKYLWEVNKNDALYEQYRSWINEPNKKFIEFHRVRTPKTQVCRLCSKIQMRKLFEYA